MQGPEGRSIPPSSARWLYYQSILSRVVTVYCTFRIRAPFFFISTISAWHVFRPEEWCGRENVRRLTRMQQSRRQLRQRPDERSWRLINFRSNRLHGVVARSRVNPTSKLISVQIYQKISFLAFLLLLRFQSLAAERVSSALIDRTWGLTRLCVCAIRH